MPNSNNQPPEKSNIRVLSILFAVLLLLITNYWVSSTWNGFSLNALFINAIFVTFLMGLLNPLLKRLGKWLVLRPSELFLIYMMLAIATGAAGHDTLEMLTQTIGHPFWFGSPENEWPELFHKNLPRWLMVEDKNVLEGFYRKPSECARRRLLFALMVKVSMNPKCSTHGFALFCSGRLSLLCFTSA